MKNWKLVFAIVGLMFTGSALAGPPVWYIRDMQGTGPKTNTPEKSALVTARAVVLHVTNVECGGCKGLNNDSIAYIGSMSKICYRTEKVAWDAVSRGPLIAKPLNAVCVWDKLSADHRARADAISP